MKIKFASNNVICLFTEYDKTKVHIANIDLRTNRLYTTLDGAKLLGEKLGGHEMLFFEEEILTNTSYNLNADIYFNSKKNNKTINKFNVCFDMKKDEINEFLKTV